MHYQMLIDGQWRGASDGGVDPVINPATEAVIAKVPFGGEDETTRAIDAAERALPMWRGMTAYDRGRILRDIADAIRSQVDDLAPIMTAECGKPLGEATGEWGACADLFDWFAEEGKTRHTARLIPQPRQTPASFCPSPSASSPPSPPGTSLPFCWRASGRAHWAAGCTIVGKPSELTPMSGMALVNVMQEAGLPAGVVNLVNGEPGIIGQTMLARPARAKAQLHGLAARRADTHARGGRWHQEAQPGARRQRACAGVCRCRIAIRGAAGRHRQVPQQWPGLHFADALLCRESGAG